MGRGTKRGVTPDDTPAGIDPNTTDDETEQPSAASELEAGDLSALEALLKGTSAAELAAALRHVKQIPDEATGRGRGCYVYRLRRGVRQLRVQIAHRDGSRPTKVQLIEGFEYPLPADPEQLCRPAGKIEHFPGTVVYRWESGRVPIDPTDISVEAVNFHRRNTRAPKLSQVQTHLRQEFGKEIADALFNREGWDGMLRQYEAVQQAKEDWPEIALGDLNPPLPEGVNLAPDRIEMERQEAQTFQGEIILDQDEFKALKRRAKRDEREAGERRHKERERRSNDPRGMVAAEASL